MPISFRVLFIALLSVGLLVACSDDQGRLPTEPSDAGLRSESFSRVASPGGALYTCRLVRHTNNGPPIVEERALDLEELGLVEAPDQRRVRWEYRVLRENGSVKSILACHIPRTQAAIQHFNDLFGVDNVTIQCGGEGDPCDLGEIKNSGSEDDDECDPYQELDFSCDDGTCMTSLGAEDELIGAQCTGSGGSGGDTGSGGTGDSGSSTTLLETFQYDEVYDLSLDPPDCDSETLKPQEVIWCEDGNPPTSAEMEALKAAAEEIVAKCSFLSDDWTRSKDNLRLFTYDKQRHGDIGGAAQPGGDWILMAYGWFKATTKGSLAHELLHLSGFGHGEDPDSEKYQAFVQQERQCTGGISTLADF